MKTLIVVVLAVSPLVVACALDPEQERLERAIGAEYNDETGRLELLTYDSDDNGTINVWTYTPARTLRSMRERGGSKTPLNQVFN